MEKERILQQTESFVKEKLYGEGTGHDWWHIQRVLNNATNIGEKEGDADMFVVKLAALLHDIADYKFHDGDHLKGGKVATDFLGSLGVEEEVINHVRNIIDNISFKGANVKDKMNTKEGMIVQDADRLDALGAMGIARTFAYGGNKGIEIYNPDIKPKKHDSFEEYKKDDGTTINHFYEKLLLLKNRMNTETARRIAEKRHEFMEEYLERFYEEWDGTA